MVKNTGQDSTTSQHLFCTKSFIASWICDCWLVILLIKENECSCNLCSHWQKSTRVFAYWNDCLGLRVVAAFCCCLSVGDDQAVQQHNTVLHCSLERAAWSSSCTTYYLHDCFLFFEELFSCSQSGNHP